MNIYDIGDQVRLSVVFTDANDTAVDPTLITVRYIKPGGSEIAVDYDGLTAVVRDGAGAYSLDLVTDTAGVWRYRWESSGTVTAAVEGRFEVRRSMFG